VGIRSREEYLDEPRALDRCYPNGNLDTSTR
jgi:hypothetical protein